MIEENNGLVAHYDLLNYLANKCGDRDSSILELFSSEEILVTSDLYQKVRWNIIAGASLAGAFWTHGLPYPIMEILQRVTPRYTPTNQIDIQVPIPPLKQTLEEAVTALRSYS